MDGRVVMVWSVLFCSGLFCSVLCSLVFFCDLVVEKEITAAQKTFEKSNGFFELIYIESYLRFTNNLPMV